MTDRNVHAEKPWPEAQRRSQVEEMRRWWTLTWVRGPECREPACRWPFPDAPYHLHPDTRYTTD